MTITFQPAVRQGVKALINLYGPSGCGKTYSAIQLMRGLVGPEGRIAFIDTEAGRGSHYADLTPYDRADLAPPFTPDRYREAIEAAEEAGYDGLIIDSISHEWEGEGGVLEWAESIELRTKKSGLHCWNKPKGAHKKLINRLLRSRLHIIFCARAREKPKTVLDDRGKQQIVSDGFQPIVEKNFPYEMLISVGMSDVAPGVPDLNLQKKIPGELAPAFPAGKHIDIETGKVLREWLDGAAPVDESLRDKAEAGREAARGGTVSLRAWWGSLGRADHAALKAFLDGELKSIASASDAFNQTMDDAANATAGDGKRPDPRRANTPTEAAIQAFILKTETINDLDELTVSYEELQEGEAWVEASADQRDRARLAKEERSRALRKDEADAPDAGDEIPFQAEEESAA
jgi:hypothetical protein